MIALSLNYLISYALDKKLIRWQDVEKYRDKLSQIFSLSSFYFTRYDVYPNIDDILSNLSYYASIQQIIENKYCDYFENEIMNIFSKTHDEIDQNFWVDFNLSSQIALDNFYQYCCAINYIKVNAIAKNKSFDYVDEDIKLEITINLSKPEKDPRDIAAALEADSFAKNQIKCDLCKENEGFSNRIKNKQTLRIIPLKLNDEKWHFQFSPYSYFYQHSIVLSDIHRPMSINDKTIRNLIEFVNLFPAYLIGSNADLPIVGGSILSHDHYQCGFHHFPIEDAKESKIINFQDVRCSILRWPLSTIKLISKNKESIINITNKIMKSWSEYENQELLIINSKTKRHNTINPIVRFDGKNYIVYIILRNNYTNEQYPDGVFHVHPEYYHIKKENIGLIEAMGLAILPPRLDKEISMLKVKLENESLVDINQLGFQREWYLQLKDKSWASSIGLDAFLQFHIGNEFKQAITCCGVFKQNARELGIFSKFLEDCLYD